MPIHLEGTATVVTVRYNPRGWTTLATVQTASGEYFAEYSTPHGEPLIVSLEPRLGPGSPVVIELPTLRFLARLVSWDGLRPLNVEQPSWSPSSMPAGMHSLFWDRDWGVYASIWEGLHFIWLDVRWEIRGITDETYCAVVPDCPAPADEGVGGLMWVPEVGRWVGTVNRRVSSWLSDIGQWQEHTFDPRPVCPRARPVGFYNGSVIEGIQAAEDNYVFRAIAAACGEDVNDAWIRGQYPTMWDHLMKEK